jgi:hypothetical protein
LLVPHTLLAGYWFWITQVPAEFLIHRRYRVAVATFDQIKVGWATVTVASGEIKVAAPGTFEMV